MILDPIMREIEPYDLSEHARKIAAVIGLEATLKLSDLLGGEYLRIPANLAISARRKWIERHLDDLTDEAIAERLNMQAVQVYEIRVNHDRKMSSFEFTDHEAKTVGVIVLAVANYFGKSLTQLRGPERTADVAWPRQVAMYLVRQALPRLTLVSIGICFGGRDPATVSNAVMVVRDRTFTNAEERVVVETLLSSILQLPTS